MVGFDYDVRSENEISRLMNEAVEVIEDLTKIWLFAYNEDVDNWIRHTRDSLRYTNRINNRNYLNKDEILLYTYEMNEDKIPKILDEYVEEFENGKYTRYMRSDHEHINKLKSGLKSYFKDLSVVLSSDGYVKSSEIAKILRNSGLMNVPSYDMDDVVKNNWLPRKYQ